MRFTYNLLGLIKILCMIPKSALNPLDSLEKPNTFRELLPKKRRDTPYLMCFWDCIYIDVLQIAYSMLGFDAPAKDKI